MYQLSHLLIEQRNILSTLREQNTTESTKDVLLDEPENGKLQFDFEKSQHFIMVFNYNILHGVHLQTLIKMKYKTKEHWPQYKNR